MVKFNLLFALLITPLVCFGQNAYDYYGEKVQLEAHYFQSQNAGKLQGDKKLSYQGMDISNGYAVSAQSTGVITVYDLNGGDMSKEKQLKLSTFSKTANAYNVSFGTKKMTEEDVLPLLYVSGNHGVLNVEEYIGVFEGSVIIPNENRFFEIKTKNEENLLLIRFQEAKDQALKQLAKEIKDHGGNGVLDLEIEYNIVGELIGDSFHIVAKGTGVLLE